MNNSNNTNSNSSVTSAETRRIPIQEGSFGVGQNPRTTQEAPTFPGGNE